MATMDDVVQYICTQERAQVSGDRKQVMMRCPICGDPKSHTSRNFSVRIDTSRGEPLLYQCFRADCQAKGLINVDFMQKYFGCNEVGLLLALSTYNGNKKEKVKKRGGVFSPPSLNFNLKKSKGSKSKVDYFNTRMGTSFDEEELAEMKVITDLPQFYYMNKLKPSPLMYYNGDNSIGFISATNDTIICRNLEPNDKVGRYFNERISIDDPEWDYNKYYIKPTEINIMSPKATEINIAEGIFSILGAYLYQEKFLKDKYSGNRLFVANNGAGYYKPIAEICKRYGFTKIIINAYSDSDFKIDKFKELIPLFRKEFITIKEFNVIYNTKKEDFGYPSANIVTKIYRIK